MQRIRASKTEPHDSDGERAWIVQQWLTGTTQTKLAEQIGIPPSAVNVAIGRFCTEWAAEDRDFYGYEQRRTVVAQIALRNYLREGGKVEQPPPHVPSRPKARQEQERARQEHAWLLRAEGLTLHQVGARLGVSRRQALTLIRRFGRRMRRAMRRTRWAIQIEKLDGEGT